MQAIYNGAYNTAASIPNLLGFESKACTIHFNAIHPGDKAPLYNQKIKVFSQGILYKQEIGTFETDQNGSMTFSYNCIKLPFQSTQSLLFQVFEETLSTKSFVDRSAEDRLVFELSQNLPIGNATIKDVEVDLYEFETDFPRLKIPLDASKRAQQWDLTDYYRIVKSAFGGKITNTFIDIIERVWGPLSIDTIREITGVTKLNLKVTPENTIDIVLNGICPNLIRKGSDFVSKIKWHDYETVGENDLPDASLHAFKDINGKLKIHHISLKCRNNSKVTHYPSDTNFEEILFKFNSLALTKGSLAHHLGTHLEVGQYAIAVKRHLNKNPIGKLLAPFLRGVLEINQKALTVIVNTLKESGLTDKGVWDNLREAVGGRCWSNYVNKTPLSAHHRLAKGTQLFSYKVDPKIDQFFEENMNDIVNYWYEIQYLSDCLLRNSLSYQPFDDREDNNGAEGRVALKDTFKAIRPITNGLNFPLENEDVDKEYVNPSPLQPPTSLELENLKQLCKYLIPQASWSHWTLHVNEKIGIDPNYARFAPERVTGNDLNQSIETQISLGKTLTDYHDGSLIDNPNGDIYPPIIEVLRDPETRKEFLAEGYDIHETFYGTII